MQVIHKNKNKRSCNKRINLVDIVVCTEGLSRCVERKSIGRFRSKSIRI